MPSSLRKEAPLSLQSGFFPSTDSGTVLVVSSSALVGRDLSEMLRTVGYKVDAASEAPNWNGRALIGAQLAVLCSSEPCWRVEQICEICSTIRRKAPNLPVIVLGPNDVETKVRLFELGADDYLLESFNHTELLARIRTLIRRQKLRSS